MLAELVKNRDVVGIKKFMDDNNLVLEGNKIVAKTDRSKSSIKRLETFYNQRQQATKIRLNATYGSLLNPTCKFNDERLGKSTTLTGRMVVRHMSAQINQTITGVYDHEGQACCYNDTDSCYFSVYETLKDNPEYKDFDWSRENIIALYDQISTEVNSTFADFMMRSFNTDRKHGEIIQASRETVASKALFIKKKKYALFAYDINGFRLDQEGKKGKLKITGLEIKRSDTPKVMQKFLEKILVDVLTDVSKEIIYQSIRDFRIDFKTAPSWEKGTPRACNGLSDYRDKDTSTQNLSLTDKKKGKINMPGHIRAALNWNELCEINGDKYSQRITDGTKLIVCKLKPNNILRMDSVAYPIDQAHQIPAWYKALPFDDEAMEEVTINNKLDNLLGVLEWDFTDTIEKTGDEFFTFG